MEVHHHTHHPKKWKEYFWEFFMLFLAVFCGFLAELQLEHYIESNREQEFIITLHEDLRNDSVLLAECEQIWSKTNSDIDSISDAIQLPFERTDILKVYRHLPGAFNYFGFTYNDRTIAQLKNSGSFRLIRNKEVSNEITLYDQFNQDAMKKIDVQHNLIYMQAMDLKKQLFHQQIMNQLFVKYGLGSVPMSASNWIDSVLKSNPIPLDGKEYNQKLFEFKNALLSMRHDYTNLQWAFDREREKIQKLKLLIRKKYSSLF
ncbi:MAG: hypothetical protein IM564_12590 [Chitinophagaceae bacterium]|jgi:hypothetical protein|nr:hypothetical protein [Chitinophagaceae bacterium]MCA6514571.1 hypothetical protein [Chitinophagaceae bacterium]MCE2972679.1 hypothetical protein [Sediminibacterium sp.]